MIHFKSRVQWKLTVKSLIKTRKPTSLPIEGRMSTVCLLRDMSVIFLINQLVFFGTEDAFYGWVTAVLQPLR
jgi:hypothetical protein